MTTRHKSVCRSTGVHIHSGFAAQPQGHVGTHAPAQGTFAAGCGALALSRILLALRSLAPVVASVHMAASEVDPGLTFFKAGVTVTVHNYFTCVLFNTDQYQHCQRLPPVAAWQAGEGQCAEAHGTLRAGRVELLAERLQVTQGGSAHEPLPRTPQQGGTAQVHQGTVS